MGNAAWQREWRFIDTGVNDGFMNMAIDEAILDAHLQGLCPPTLRVYRWSPPTCTLGYFQNPEAEIEQKRCDELGIDVVRRLTGGKAVLHHDELTYSVVISPKEYNFPESLAGSYRLLNECLIAAFRLLGLEVCLEAHEKEPSSAACFSSAGLADLTCQGRKICGSAQYRKDNVLLQHGSLPISFDAQLFFSILKFPSTALRDQAQADYGQKAASLDEVLGKVGWQELKKALFHGFQTALGIKLVQGSLTPEEIDLSQMLAREKYKSYEWNCNGRHETRLVSKAFSPG
ncbi:MAG: lipoate--protein ligase family protein [Anaerolineales bacterium]|nr:lipoate--protein ligase family protein [Anaerolineales bacterium]